MFVTNSYYDDMLLLTGSPCSGQCNEKKKRISSNYESLAADNVLCLFFNYPYFTSSLKTISVYLTCYYCHSIKVFFLDFEGIGNLVVFVYCLRLSVFSSMALINKL